MKYKIAIIFVCTLFFLNIFNVNSVFAQEIEDDQGELEAELTIDEDVPLIEYGEIKTINMTYTQRGLNWTFLYEEFGFVATKIIWPGIIFRDIKDFLGYNSVVFTTEIVGNPAGWTAWVEPSSVAKFTGDMSKEIKLYVKVDRPTTVNQATIKVRYVAKAGNNAFLGSLTNDVLVKVRPYHMAELKPLIQIKEVTPNTIINFPIVVTNLGNYQDTFSLEVIHGIDGSFISFPGQITLDPGESGEINAIILTPKTFFYDFGTGRNITIAAYSIMGESNTTAQRFPTTFQFTTKGFYLSDLFVSVISIFLIIIIALLTLYYFTKEKVDSYLEKRKKNRKQIKKTNKPRLFSKSDKRSQKKEIIEPFQPIDEELQEFQEVNEPKNKQRRKPRK